MKKGRSRSTVARCCWWDAPKKEDREKHQTLPNQRKSFAFAQMFHAPATAMATATATAYYVPRMVPRLHFDVEVRHSADAFDKKWKAMESSSVVGSLTANTSALKMPLLLPLQLLRSSVSQSIRGCRRRSRPCSPCLPAW
jgi:hypothetical protein